jgi:hypothetical protein
LVVLAEQHLRGLAELLVDAALVLDEVLGGGASSATLTSPVMLSPANPSASARW